MTVSGTAQELNALFAEFGRSFEGLGASISFRVTDGGEVTLNAAQLDVLDGRLTGAAIVVDDSTGVASMLEGAISTTVKDITVDNDGDLSTPDNLILTVNQFRNLPTYVSDNVVIRDSEIQINRALSYGTLDERVISLELTNPGMDGGLTLNVATAEKLGERDIRVNGAPAPLVVRDRASAIANFIETGSLPEMGSVMFVESRGKVIDLNDEQLAAWNRLSEYTNVLTNFGGVTGAQFEANDLQNVYIDQRLSDLSKALDASDPLGQYDQYRTNLKNWNDKIEDDWQAKLAEGHASATSTANEEVSLLQDAALTEKAAERVIAQDKAVADGRLDYQNDAWEQRQPLLPGERLIAQDDAVAVSRANAQDQAADEQTGHARCRAYCFPGSGSC